MSWRRSIERLANRAVKAHTRTDAALFTIDLGRLQH